MYTGRAAGPGLIWGTKRPSLTLLAAVCYTAAMMKLPGLIMGILLLCQPIAALADKPDLPGVDLKDLDADETEILVNVLKKQFDPCGKSRSFLDSVKDPKTCSLAPKLANFCVDQIARGLSKRQVIKALLKEQKRLTMRHKFTLTGRPAYGPKNARIVVVEFYDFQCPHCRLAASKVKELVKNNKDVRVVHKQYPLDFHPAAKTAAIAALAAHKQGKFTDLHDKFFEDQEKLDDELIGKIVAGAGLDMAKYVADRKGAEKIVAQDKAEGDGADIEGTPTFFVNGLMVDYDGLDKAIEAARGK